MISEFAPAKINLYLHVGPVRTDGLHELRSLFAFVGDGDCITARPADALSLTVTGPFAASLSGEDPDRNLVMRAARALQRATGMRAGASITLDKRLPVAAGIGGGSADAAATLRVLMKVWNLHMGEEGLAALAFSLGADVPACLQARPVLVSGAGERRAPGPRLAPLHATLVNPLVAMPTGPIFRAFDRANPAPPPPAFAPCAVGGIDAARALMAASRNDLEPFAMAQSDAVGAAIALLRKSPGAIGARMSGSGATAFALFSDGEAAVRAARAARGRGWWATSARLLAGAGA